MPESRMIPRYLADLGATLRLGRRYRRRVLAETEEHLLEVAARHEAEGTEPAAAASAAVAAFGTVEEVAAAFHRRGAARAIRVMLVAAVVVATIEAVAQALGPPFFWHYAGGGIRPAGPWPFAVKDGVNLAAGLRAVADVVTMVAIGVAALGWARSRRLPARAGWLTAVSGSVAAGGLGVAALAGVAELGIGQGIGPGGGQRTAATGLLLGAGVLMGGAVGRTGWRLWAVRSGWLPSIGLARDIETAWSRLNPRVRVALRRGLAVVVPATLVVTFAAGLFEVTHQRNLRSGANDPQLQVAASSAHSLAGGSDPATVASGPKVDLARSLGVHVTVFDASGHVLASTAELDGRTPVPPAGVLRYARHQTDVLTWQPRPAVRVAAVATPWSGPQGTGTIVVGRSLKVVEQRESRLMRHVIFWWLLAMALVLLAALAAGARPPPRSGAERRALNGEPGVAAA